MAVGLERRCLCCTVKGWLPPLCARVGRCRCSGCARSSIPPRPFSYDLDVSRSCKAYIPSLALSVSLFKAALF
eukprot:1161645-Pelagomonas_calceolata.AAC.16